MNGLRTIKTFLKTCKETAARGIEAAARFLKPIKKILRDGLLSLFFPSICPSCKRYIKDFTHVYICEKCFNDIKPVPDPHCEICQKPLDTGATLTCRECRDRKNYFSYTMAAGAYQGALKEMIHFYKFNKKKRLYKMLSEIMLDNIHHEVFEGIDIIVPAPLSRKSLEEREYNQTELIASYLSYKLGIPAANLVIKTKETERQSSLEREKRLTNLKGAFDIKKEFIDKVEGRNILVVDDVYTTGSTINEIARTLVLAGAEEVRAVTVARAV